MIAYLSYHLKKQTFWDIYLQDNFPELTIRSVQESTNLLWVKLVLMLCGTCTQRMCLWGVKLYNPSVGLDMSCRMHSYYRHHCWRQYQNKNTHIHQSWNCTNGHQYPLHLFIHELQCIDWILPSLQMISDPQIHSMQICGSFFTHHIWHELLTDLWGANDHIVYKMRFKDVQVLHQSIDEDWDDGCMYSQMWHPRMAQQSISWGQCAHNNCCVVQAESKDMPL